MLGGHGTSADSEYIYVKLRLEGISSKLLQRVQT